MLYFKLIIGYQLNIIIREQSHSENYLQVRILGILRVIEIVEFYYSIYFA